MGAIFYLLNKIDQSTTLGRETIAVVGLLSTLNWESVVRGPRPLVLKRNGDIQ